MQAQVGEHWCHSWFTEWTSPEDLSQQCVTAWTLLLWRLTQEGWGEAGEGFLSLPTGATLNWIILCCGACPLCYRRTHPPVVTTENVCRHCQMPQGTKLVLPPPTPVENQWPAASVFFTSSPGASNTQPGPEPFMLPNPIFFFFYCQEKWWVMVI